VVIWFVFIVEYVRREDEWVAQRGFALCRRFYSEFTEEYYKGFYIDSFGKKIYIEFVV